MRTSSAAPTTWRGGWAVSDALEIPTSELSPELLRSIVESVVLREGTDYGVHEYSFDDKVAQLLRQLRLREARILFDPESETVDIVKR